MSVLVSILFMGLLALVVYQDFRYRSLSIALLAGLFLFAAGNTIFINGWKQALIYAGENVLLIGVQLIGILIYFSLKHKRIINIVNTYLGSGDVWFYGILAFCFSPLNFVLFNLSICFIVLVAYATAALAKPNGRTIPLAGCMALGLMLLVLISRFFQEVQPYNDMFWMSKLLTR